MPRLNLPEWLQNVALVSLAVVVVAGAAIVLTEDRSVHGSGSTLPSGTAPTSASTSARTSPVASVFFGDSLVAGANTTSSSKTFTAVAARALGWEQTPFGYPGSGFTTPGTYQGGKTYLTRAEGLRGYTADVVIVEGGLNDGGASATVLRTRVLEFLDRLHELVPSAKVVLMGPWSPSGTPDAVVVRTDTALRAIATEASVPYVSPITEHWITGKYPSSGSARYDISSDGFYPNDAGHAHFGALLAADLRRLLPASLFTS